MGRYTCGAKSLKSEIVDEAFPQILQAGFHLIFTAAVNVPGITKVFQYGLSSIEGHQLTVETSRKSCCNQELVKSPESYDEAVAFQVPELDLFLAEIHIPDLEFLVAFVNAWKS